MRGFVVVSVILRASLAGGNGNARVGQQTKGSSYDHSIQVSG